MPNLHELIATFARAEAALQGQEFVAPLMQGGRGCACVVLSTNWRWLARGAVGGVAACTTRIMPK